MLPFKGGRWRNASGNRFASKKDVKNAIISDWGLFQNKSNRWQQKAGGAFARKAEVERIQQVAENRSKAANERVNVMEWNNIKNDNVDYRGFLEWTKEAWTGRNRGKDRTSAILYATGAENMHEAFSMYKLSKANLLYESIKNIDASTLINEFKGFLPDDIYGYIQELRDMGIGSDELYAEAIKQTNAYIAQYGR